MNILYDLNKTYIPSEKTNVLATLKRLGWEPPSEDRRYQQKWQTYRHLAVNNEEGAK